MTILAPEDLSSILGITEDKLDCAGLKLTLGEIYKFKSKGYLGINKRKLPEYEEIKPVSNLYRLSQGVYLVKYNEYVEIPNGYIGLAIQRSTLLRIGASLYTAVWDPGYHGRGSGLLVVHNPYGIVLEKNTQLAQLVILKMSRTTRFIYRGVYLGEQ